MPLLYPSTSIQTYTGVIFDVLHPDPEQICIEDIAHALSNLCRFGGHVKNYYSVAQHSVIMSTLDIVPKELKLTALLHDASEAYLVDVPSPIKGLLPEYQAIEESIQRCVCEKFNLIYPFDQVIHDADRIMLEKEMMLYMQSARGLSWSALAAEKMFLIEYKKLTR